VPGKWRPDAALRTAAARSHSIPAEWLRTIAARHHATADRCIVLSARFSHRVARDLAEFGEFFTTFSCPDKRADRTDGDTGGRIKMASILNEALEWLDRAEQEPSATTLRRRRAITE
jgi:hypothetical protein